MRDQYFTPGPVAEAIVARLRSQSESIVADFAAGDGELLRAAQKRWPQARIVAADIDAACVRRLRRLHPKWTIHNHDFLHCDPRHGAARLFHALGEISLILLNPPFSQR